MSYKAAVLWGIGIWAFVFIVAILAFPLRENERPLFESIIPVALVLAVTFASTRNLKSITNLSSGVRIGVIWLAVNFIIDQLMFSAGPMKMAFIDYMKDIGITYLLIPIITAGIGYTRENRSK